jgi:hypothetical protein
MFLLYFERALCCRAVTNVHSNAAFIARTVRKDWGVVVETGTVLTRRKELQRKMK